MADSTNPLDQIEVGQSQPAVLANELFDAVSPAAVFGRRARTCSGLTWGYYGGRYGGDAIADGTIVLPASQASVYIVADKSDGTVSQSTSATNWNDSDNYQRLYLATTGSATVTAYEDHREWIASASATSNEEIQDIVGALIVAGSGITVTYDDASSPPEIEIAATGGGLNQEEVEDLVDALLVAGTGVVLTYDDAATAATLKIDTLIPQNSQSTAYTTVLTDGSKHILHPIADNNARTFTIDSNANVAYPIGTAITFVNLINVVTIAITSDTMYLAGAGTTGSRTLAAYGVATALKVASTSWIISGTGLT
jgi:hypothetical protein